MGNSASNANNPPRNTTSTSNRNSSTSPSPGNPHRSMGIRRRSLELPDLASLNLTPASAVLAANRGRSKAQSIPIPTNNQPPNPFKHYEESREIQPDERVATHLPSTSDLLDEIGGYPSYQQLLHPPSTNQPFPPPIRSNRSTSQSSTGAPRGRQQYPSRNQQQSQQQSQQLRQIQELYDQSQYPVVHSSSPPPLMAPGSGRTRPGFKTEVVRSSIPIPLGKLKEPEVPANEIVSPTNDDLLADPVPIKIVWRGGGKQVILARAGDDDWKGRTPMTRDPVNNNIWTLVVQLQPGTHHVRFLVDGQWRVADDLPAAVDDQGSLANYVAVPLNYGVPGQIPTTQGSVPPPISLPLQPASIRKVIPGQSFWSNDSSADGEDDHHTTTITSVRTHGPTSPANQIKEKNERAAAAYIQARWTNVLPPELIEAAREEEAYVAASAGQYDHPTGNTRVTGFVPTPNIPPAPGLPRHLDKLILNSRVGEQKSSKGEGSVNGSNNGGSGVGGSGIGSGQASSSRRERRERERDRDRDRERDRGERERERHARSSRRQNFPPAPPPSVDGDAGDDYDLHPGPPPNSTVSLPLQSESSPYYSNSAYHSPPFVPPYGPGSNPTASTSTKNNGSDGTISANNNNIGNTNNGSGSTVGTSGRTPGDSTPVGTAAASPHTSSPATPTGPQTPPKGSLLVGTTGTGPIPAYIAAQLGGSTYISSIAGASSSTSSNNPTNTSLAPQLSAASTSTPPQSSLYVPSPPTSYPVPPSLERAPISGSRAITIDMSDMPQLTDDGSVLPVPSHVVLHHLCTSAIRNGVLAVANTTRYRKKYLTTIYYKPTSLS